MTRRLRNLCIFTAAYVVALFGRRPSTQAPERILLVPAGKLGDVVCTTPVMRAVRAHLPHAKLYIREYGNTNAQLLAESGLVDGYLNAVTVRDYSRELRRLRIDTVLLTGPSLEDVAAALIARVPRIIAPRIVGGYSPLETRPYKMLGRFVTLFPYRVGAYAPRERLRCLEPLGIITDDTTKRIGFSDAASMSMNRFLAEQDIDRARDFVVGITPSAGHKIKEWPIERFAEVADYIAARYRARVIIIGGPKDHTHVEETMRHMKDATRATTAVGFSIDELKALISKLNLFISVDTGPIYIAEAFAIPTIDITGPIDEKEQPPRGPLHRNVVPPQRVRPELFVLNARSYNRAEALRQVQSITVSLVKNEIDLLLADMKKQQ
ncbi:MAG: glycosyltransferase family 9 protein [bacterium]|nr:glycosyltransferase family 9 protein [bacterium]